MAGQYLGADLNGTVRWDNKLYFVNSDPKLRTAMKDIIKASHLAEHLVTFDEMALKAVCLNPTVPDDYSLVGNTRFGGLPDLPRGLDYPTKSGPYRGKGFEHVSFLAQINCAEVASLQRYLPRTGMLYFFVENEDEYTSDVRYYPNSDQLITAKSLNNMEYNNPYNLEPYKPYKAEFRKLIALPAYYDGRPFYQHEDDAYLSAEKVYTKADARLFSENLGRKGVYRRHNGVYYTDMNHTINDSLYTFNDDSPNELAANSRGGNPEDWMVLLRLYSHSESGLQFNDAGELYFMIHKSDLAKKDFGNVFTFCISS